MQRIAAVCLTLPVLTLAPGIAHAVPWWGEASVGVLSTSGNSDTRSINGKFTLDYLDGPWRNDFASQVLSGATDGQTTSEQYSVNDKVDYTFYQENYAFLAGDFNKDLFGGIRESTSETGGLGRHFLTGPDNFLDGEIGIGARQQQEQGSRQRDDDFIGRAAVDYRYKLSNTSGFHQNLKVETGQSNTSLLSTTELKLYILGNLFASLIYTVQHNSQVDPGIKHTDTTTALNFSYAFGKKPT